MHWRCQLLIIGIVLQVALLRLVVSASRVIGYRMIHSACVTLDEGLDEVVGAISCGRHSTMMLEAWLEG